MALGGGIVYVGMLFAAAASFGVWPLAVAVGEQSPTDLDPHLGRVLVQLGFAALLIFGLLAASLMVLSQLVMALRTGLLPRWLGWSGVVVAILLMAGPLYMPQVLVPLWVVTAGVSVRPPELSDSPSTAALTATQ